MTISPVLRVMLGLGLLIAGLITWRLVVGRSAPAGVTELRIGYTGAYLKDQEVFEQLAKEYAKLHPGILIKPQFIPGVIYSAWSTTQLVGATAPDIMQMDHLTDEQLARYFRTITEEVAVPNPYNEGTPMAEVPWRDTFYDALAYQFSYRESLAAFYGVGMFRGSVRLIFNRDLLAEITGERDLPVTFEDYWRLFRQVESYNAGRDAPIIPIAASRLQGRWFLEFPILTQTLPLLLRHDANRDLLLQTRESLSAYLAGAWTFEDPTIRRGLDLARELSRGVQTGFLQAGGDEAVFQFSQRRAIVIAALSTELDKITEAADFEIGIGEMPVPGPQSGIYRDNYLGRGSESSLLTSFNLGVTKNSRHPEVAVDFLRFITSVHGNAHYARVNRAVPAVRGVEVEGIVRDFLPRDDGLLSGMWPLRGDAEVTNFVWLRLHRLVSQDGGVDDFTQAMRDGYRTAVIRDLTRSNHTARMRIQTQDGVLTALVVGGLTERRPGQFEGLLDNQSRLELEWLQNRKLLDKTQSQVP